MTIANYSFHTANRIVAGCQTIQSLAEELKQLPKVKRALVLSQPSIEKSGYLTMVLQQLQKAGIDCSFSLDIKPEPTVSNIIEVHNRYKQEGYDLVVGIGGGSVLDAAKLMSVLITNDKPLHDMIGIELIPEAGVPTVLIPSTSGTGSEVTPNAIVTLPERELKLGIVSRHLLPKLVIMDPELTISLPRAVTAATGMDAFTHALESFISNKANPISDMFALESIRKISRSIETAYDQGTQVKAREEMLIGSMFGGMALTAAGTAAVHAMAYPIGGKFNVTHGVANAMLLPHVMAFNLDAITERMSLVAEAMGLGVHKPNQAAELVLRQLVDWTSALQIPQSLASYGVQRSDVPELALAASQVTRLMNNNPKAMTVHDIEQIYMKLL